VQGIPAHLSIKANLSVKECYDVEEKNAARLFKPTETLVEK
jgi:hypothetical protein